MAEPQSGDENQKATLAGGFFAFQVSPRALKGRRALVISLKLALMAVAWALALAVDNSGVAAAIKWALAFMITVGLYEMDGAALFRPLLDRELRLQPGAIEERRGLFTRFITYERFEHLRVTQDLRERVTRIVIDTDEGSLALWGYEGMERLFAELAARKPGRVMIEVQVRRFSIAPESKALAAILLGASLSLAALWGREISPEALRRACGALLALAALSLLAWRPFSKKGTRKAQVIEILIALALGTAGLGWIL